MGRETGLSWGKLGMSWGGVAAACSWAGEEGEGGRLEEEKEEGIKR